MIVVSQWEITSMAKNVGFVFDSCLTVENYINGIVKTINSDIFCISKIKHYLPTETSSTVVCALILASPGP